MYAATHVAAAVRYLADTEGFDRGLYSGPFGWMSGGGAEFVVAIRSALLPSPQEQALGSSNSSAQVRVQQEH
jgi:isochorismate synthase EntC